MYLELKYKRSTLSEDQREFLLKLIPFARLLQDQIKEKITFCNRNSPIGLSTSIVCAFIIMKSSWGKHSVCETHNNPSLMEADKYWKGKSIEIAGIKYKKFNSWLDFCVSFSDHIVFTRSYDDTLSQTNISNQLKKFTENAGLSHEQYTIMKQIIVDYGLFEFEVYCLED